MNDDDKKRYRFELLLDRDDYDFLGWMLYQYKEENRSVAARVCIRMVREWERRRGNYPPHYDDSDTTAPVPRQNGELTSVAKMHPENPEQIE